MPGALPISSDPGAGRMCITRNEYEPRSRQNEAGRHSGAISPPDVFPSRLFPNCAGSSR